MLKHIKCPLPFRGEPERGSQGSGFGFSDHTHHFRQWIGRTLSNYERRIINRLERQRRQRAVKVHIVDQYGQDSTQLLIDYMRYLQEIYPTQPCVIYSHTKKEAKQIGKTFPGTTFPASVKKPFSVRGMNYDMALVINPPERYLNDIIRTVIPAIWNRPGCIVIFLTVSPPRRPRQRKPYIPPNLPPFYYQQLADPPNPPPRDPDKLIIIDLTDYQPEPSEVSLFTSYSLLLTSRALL